jgi:hypothetical protein
MSDLWGVTGANIDEGYVNLCAAEHACEGEMRCAIDALWAVYEPYADPDFASGFARDPDGRFWEMRLGVWLLEGGKNLLPAAERLIDGGQPDLCVLEEDGRVWIEAIAPQVGAAGPDQVVGPVPANENFGVGVVPRRQAQLRTTSALFTKSEKIKSYLQQGVIAAEDRRLVAISPCRFPLYVDEHPLPLIMSSVFPLGDEYVTIDAQTGEVVNHGFEHSLHIERTDGKVVPRTAFLTEEFAHISGVAWSRYSIGGMNRQERPLTLVHNPRAVVKMPTGWGVWDREFVITKAGGSWEATDILAAQVPPT